MRRYIPELDGLRSFAIISVMLVHLGIYSHMPSVFVHGGMGVDLFFVLSGYLITGILLDAKGKRGYYRNFFARRGLRIWPLYYVVLVATVLISRAAPPFGFQVDGWLGFFAYTCNISNLAWPPWPIAVIWSLCVEEQFYLVWPMLVSVCSAKSFPRVLVGIVVAELALRWWLAATGVPDMTLYRNTLTRLDGLALGSLVSVLSQAGNLNFRRAGYLFLALMFAMWGITRFAPLSLRIAAFYQYVAFGCTALLCLTLSARGGIWSKLLSWKPLVGIGRISYGLYLLHFPVYYIVAHTRLRPGVLLMAAQLFSSFALAALSWWCFESPILRLKRFFQSEADSGFAGSSLVATASTAPAATSG